MNIISPSDVFKFLREHQVFTVSDEEVYLLVRYFETDLHHGLNYKEFGQILLPCENSNLRNEVLNRRSYARVSPHVLLAREIENTMVEILLKEI